MVYNLPDAEMNLSEIIKLIEEGKEDVIYIAQNGREVAQITRAPARDVSRRIGAAAEKLRLPDGFDELFDSLDAEVAEQFNGTELL